MNMGEEVSHLKAHVNTFYNNGALQRASEQPHLKTNQKPSQINKKVGSQETSVQPPVRLPRERIAICYRRSKKAQEVRKIRHSSAKNATAVSRQCLSGLNTGVAK
ncbi:hypothetical protein [Ruegeria sp.]|uniref:hypothetical protein n=1 Tax=Ruegeria sp. TaxID=1879320 RepID=UPI003AFFDC64